MTQVKKIIAKDLTKDQRDEFFKLFYDLTDFDDKKDVCPCGSPWLLGCTIYLLGKTVEEWVKDYITEYQEDFRFSLSDEPYPEVCCKCGDTEDLNDLGGSEEYMCSSCLSD